MNGQIMYDLAMQRAGERMREASRRHAVRGARAAERQRRAAEREPEAAPAIPDFADDMFRDAAAQPRQESADGRHARTGS
jgi:hypothetical protein